jgi:glycosyltransferase involved in cell wall biosynthesis
MARPLVSIVVTCHNQFDFIDATVRSALAQENPNCEIIVFDDASTDSSFELLGAFDNQVQLIRLDRNQGMSGARNAGADAASGKYLAFLDGDDLLKPWALTLYERLVRAYDPKVILANMTWFRQEAAQPLQLDTPSEMNVVRYENLVEKDRVFSSCGSAVVLERETFARVGGFTPSVKWFPEQDLLAKLAYSGRTIQIIEPRTVFYRVHSSNTIHMIGGPAFYGVKRAYRAGMRSEALKLLLRAWPCVGAAALARLAALAFGQRPIEHLTVQESASVVT